MTSPGGVSRKKRIAIAVVAISAIALLGFMLWATRTPLPPFAFFRKYRIVEWRDSDKPNIKIAVLDGSVDAVWRDIEAELGKLAQVTSSSVSSVNGVTTKAYEIQTPHGAVRVSNRLMSTDKRVSAVSSLSNESQLPPGQCAVAFTRQKSLFERALDWFRGLTGNRRSPSFQEELPVEETQPGNSGSLRI